jgi:hypothetical protein
MKFLFIILFLIPVAMQAQTSYTTLTPIKTSSQEYVKTTESTNDLSAYLDNMFKLGIALCTGLAVLMIIIGGIQYVSSDAWSKKTDGKDRIVAALFGLLIALGSYALLKTINPDLLSTKLTLTPVNTTNIPTVPGGGTSSGGGGNYNEPLAYNEQTGGYEVTPQKVAIDTDGSGAPPFHDPDRKSQTSYKDPVTGKYLNANTDNYVVVPVGSDIPLGSKVKMTNSQTGKEVWGIVGDRGPGYGEVSLNAARELGIWQPGDGNSTSQGTKNGSITYTFFPGS